MDVPMASAIGLGHSAGRIATCEQAVRYQKTSFDELPEVVWALLHYVDLLPNSSSRLTQSERLFGQLQIVCCKRHQLFGNSRPGTCLGESNAPFGQLPVVFGTRHS
jgi:hypothetical protein